MSDYTITDFTSVGTESNVNVGKFAVVAGGNTVVSPTTFLARTL